MKKKKLLCLACMATSAIMLGLTSCNDVVNEMFDNSNNLSNIECNVRGFSTSVRLANELRHKTRSSNEIKSVEFVLQLDSKNSKKNNEQLDTVAYIINYADNGGFVIISNSRFTTPVIASSDEGNFNTSSDIAKTLIMPGISNFVNSAGSSKNNIGVGDIPIYKDTVTPSIDKIVPAVVQINLGQRYPYNKVVDQLHPGCPVGCVAVAAGMILPYSQEKLKYSGYDYNFTWMRSYLETNDSRNKSLRDSMTTEQPIDRIWDDSYEGATWAMSQLLSDLGENIGARYSTSVTLAFSNRMRDQLSSIGCETTPYNKFDTNEVYSKLCNDWLIYIDGEKVSNGDWHAFVIDGCYIQPDERDLNIKNTYFHCNWGEYGYCNGYFMGDIFNMTNEINYKPLYYFAVKIKSE